MNDCGPQHDELLETAHGSFCVRCGQLLGEPPQDNLIIQETIEPGGSTEEPQIREANIQGHSLKRLS